MTRHVESTAKRTVTRFSHAAHASLAGEGREGCFACHAFQGADDADPRARPALLPGVLDCTKCHGGHANLAGGACSFCHPAGSAAGGDEGSARLFRGERPSRDDWPAGSGFAHFSGSAARGHASYVLADGANAERGCAACHPPENLRAARRVRDVGIPDVGGSLCFECHPAERGWFHWPLPDPESASAAGR
jgi:hypothetical protein